MPRVALSHGADNAADSGRAGFSTVSGGGDFRAVLLKFPDGTWEQTDAVGKLA